MINIILIITSLLSTVIGTYLLSQSRNSKLNLHFAIVCLISTLWTLSNLAANLSDNIFWLQSAYALGTLVIISSLFWVNIFTNSHTSSYYISIWLVAGLTFFLLSYAPNFLTLDNKVEKGLIFTGGAGVGLFLFTIFYVIVCLNILSNLYRHYKYSNGSTRSQALLILCGASISLLVTLFSSFILPQFPYFLFGGIDNVGFLFFIIFVCIATSKYSLFNVKIFNLHFIILTLLCFQLIRILSNIDKNGIILDTFIFILTLIFGTLIIKSIFRIRDQTRQIQILTDKLITKRKNELDWE